MYIYASSIKEIAKKISLFKSLYDINESVYVYLTGSVRIDGETRFIHDQRITDDLKQIDFHQYNGLKKPLKFVKGESLQVVIRTH